MGMNVSIEGSNPSFSASKAPLRRGFLCNCGSPAIGLRRADVSACCKQRGLGHARGLTDVTFIEFTDFLLVRLYELGGIRRGSCTTSTPSPRSYESRSPLVCAGGTGSREQGSCHGCRRAGRSCR